MESITTPMLEEKKKLVSLFAKKMKHSKTVLIASTKNLPSAQFQSIKKNLRGKAEIKIAKKSIITKAIAATEKGTLQNLKDYIASDIAIFFSDIDTFELSALLSDNQSLTKVKSGEIAPDDISIEPGPTDLMPGPAISELSGVGLKVAIEGGKIVIKQGKIVAKKGDAIKENVASVLGKLNILPMKVGFAPIASYDSISDKIYVDIKIDKIVAFEFLKEAIAKALNFAINIFNINEKTISYFIAKAGLEGKALEKLISSKSSSLPDNQNNKEEA